MWIINRIADNSGLFFLDKVFMTDILTNVFTNTVLRIWLQNIFDEETSIFGEQIYKNRLTVQQFAYTRD